jgi:signal transduction histidine kinase/ActR/RegA family two-component response regulator
VSQSDPKDRDRCVLALVPTSKDASVTRKLLSSHGILLEICPTFDALIQELRCGAAAILLPEETASLEHNATLRAILAQQPPWSDLPVLILTKSGADSAALNEVLRTFGNVTLLERPVRAATLLSAVRTAIRSRERQYQIRGYLADRAQAEESLRIADQRKDEFLATLGHELRNPLAPLLTGLELLKLAGIKDPRAANVTAVMQRQISHLVRLVDDLLEISRITRGVIELQREPLDLASIVRSAVDTSRPAMDEARHELTVDVSSESIVVTGDAVRLTQVFANLLTNAAKYTNAGGHIWFAVRKEGERAIVSVRDDGIGIPPAQLASVFDMFTQVDRSNRRSQGGLGIGLTLVRSLVTLHGGRVEARSPGSGAGSEFIVDLPILIGRRIRTHTAKSLGRIPPKRILLVDDNRDAGETLGALLSELGATVSLADSGPAALEMLRTFQPDAVLLDIGMPEMDGYEVARRIRATPDRGRVLLIALTGWGQEDDLRRSLAAGFDHHLVKPPDVDRLRELLMARSASDPVDGSARD